LWEAQNLTTTYTRAGSVPFTIGQSRSSDIWGHQFQFADTLSWTKGQHYLRFGASVMRHESGGTGSEPGTATLGTFTFKNTTTAPFGSLTLSDVQNYQQPISFGIDRYDLTQWLLTGFVQDSIRVGNDLVLDLGLRYDRQTLSDAKTNFAPRIGFGWHPGGDPKTSIRGGYGMYYTQIRSNAVAGYLVNGLDGLTTYTAIAGQTGFPTCLTCVPVNVDPKTIPPALLPKRDITIVAGKRDFYTAQFARYGLDFSKIAALYPDELVNPRSQVFTIGAEHEFFKGFFVGADYVRQHLSNIDRTVDLNAPSPLDRTQVGQCRLGVGTVACNLANSTIAGQNVAAADATRPILPVNGGVRQINTIMNFGVADYNGLQTLLSYRGHSRVYASLSYTLSKATNTTEPDGNGIAANQPVLGRLGEEERGPSVVDQRHRAVAIFTYRFPWNFTAGTLAQFASARPFNATTGADNNGDGANNDRPVINGAVMPKSFFRGSATSEVAIFIQNRIRLSDRMALTLRLEGFNIFNHANMLGRGQTIYSTLSSGIDTATVRPDYGAFTTTFTDATNKFAIPAFANIDPPRMFQLQARFNF
ncbi:MAG TPA: TonB-dependent receptor, partial [Pyrinomonadaceae bacterium]|nr:TonB-dependent receptor [Pyrinomonadaceae bacterium]